MRRSEEDPLEGPSGGMRRSEEPGPSIAVCTEEVCGSSSEESESAEDLDKPQPQPKKRKKKMRTGGKIRASRTPQRPSGAAGGPSTRSRTRAERVQQEDFDPSDHPVLTLKGPGPGQFRIEYLKKKKIGAGGFGAVFAGVRRSDGLLVAIKTVKKSDILLTTVVGKSGRQYQLPTEVVMLLKAGGDSSCAGQHAAVSLIEWFETKASIIIVMERPEESMDLGETINQLDVEMSEDVAKDMFQSITQCVLEIMDRGVVHRDIKCENILVQKCPQSLHRFRIVDFGCARELEVRYNGFFPGTAKYFPPELYLQGWYHAQSICVWQLGAVLFELLNGKNTFTMTRRTGQFREGLSKDYHDFLDSCLNFHWFERPSLQNLLSHPCRWGGGMVAAVVLVQTMATCGMESDLGVTCVRPDQLCTFHVLVIPSSSSYSGVELGS
uniref:Serine/threonine-protein kinase 1 n=1 Tax=Knipowitschia caucasica TaxID=637954 RepID=A0AAV2LCJ4_KNICA